jgi:predicted O-methyltransferase YrrM
MSFIFPGIIMQFREIREKLAGIPIMPPEDGKLLYDFVLNNPVEEILELGFLHGVSTCYMAAALQEKGKGKILTIDCKEINDLKPSIHELLEKTCLGKYVEPVYANTSYTWELMIIIEGRTYENKCQPLYDFCFIDGAHSWAVDGFAFFLVEKLLKPGGWLLFDDLDWSYSMSQGLKDTDLVKNMPDDEKNTPQIERVFSLLVAQHPEFTNFKVQKRFGWAQKKDNLNMEKALNANPIDALYSMQSIVPDIMSILRKIKYRIKK